MNLDMLELQLTVLESQQQVLASAVAAIKQLIYEAKEREKRPQSTGLYSWDSAPSSMTLSDISRVTGRNLSTVKRWTKQPWFPGRKVDGVWLVDKEILRNALHQRDETEEY